MLYYDQLREGDRLQITFGGTFVSAGETSLALIDIVLDGGKSPTHFTRAELAAASVKVVRPSVAAGDRVRVGGVEAVVVAAPGGGLVWVCGDDGLDNRLIVAGSCTRLPSTTKEDA